MMTRMDNKQMKFHLVTIEKSCTGRSFSKKIISPGGFLLHLRRNRRLLLPEQWPSMR